MAAPKKVKDEDNILTFNSYAEFGLRSDNIKLVTVEVSNENSITIDGYDRDTKKDVVMNVTDENTLASEMVRKVQNYMIGQKK